MSEVTKAMELEVANASEGVGLSELSEEDVEVLTPLFPDLQPVKGNCFVVEMYTRY